jgi:hypothetical protein
MTYCGGEVSTGGSGFAPEDEIKAAEFGNKLKVKLFCVSQTEIEHFSSFLHEQHPRGRGQDRRSKCTIAPVSTVEMNECKHSCAMVSDLV